MLLAAHQPNYLPNLAFFHKMMRADLFVIISNIQFEKQEGWQQRHKIKGPNGDIWLTVPVLGSQNQLIRDVRIHNALAWSGKHKRTLELTYGKSKGRQFLKTFTKIYDKDHQRLVDFNVAAIFALKEILGIKTPVVVDEEVSGIKHELLMSICKKYKADEYLSGVGWRLYMEDGDIEKLEKEGIRHQVVEKNLTAAHPYSTVHYLFSEGRDWVNEEIK